jgi:hypothetical protein
MKSRLSASNIYKLYLRECKKIEIFLGPSGFFNVQVYLTCTAANSARLLSVGHIINIRTITKMILWHTMVLIGVMHGFLTVTLYSGDNTYRGLTKVGTRLWIQSINDLSTYIYVNNSISSFLYLFHSNSCWSVYVVPLLMSSLCSFFLSLLYLIYLFFLHNI